jgi:hypothetical protein
MLPGGKRLEMPKRLIDAEGYLLRMGGLQPLRACRVELLSISDLGGGLAA